MAFMGNVLQISTFFTLSRLLYYPFSKPNSKMSRPQIMTVSSFPPIVNNFIIFRITLLWEIISYSCTVPHRLYFLYPMVGNHNFCGCYLRWHPRGGTYSDVPLNFTFDKFLYSQNLCGFSLDPPKLYLMFPAILQYIKVVCWTSETKTMLEE